MVPAYLQPTGGPTKGPARPQDPTDPVVPTLLGHTRREDQLPTPEVVEGYGRVLPWGTGGRRIATVCVNVTTKDLAFETYLHGDLWWQFRD